MGRFIAPDRPARLEAVFAAGGRLGVPASLVVPGLIVLANSDWAGLGGDGQRYLAAAHAWLAGMNPWDTGDPWAHFAGSPTVVMLFVPFTGLSEGAFLAVWMGLVVGATALVLRRLGLAWYWLAFAPLVDGILKGQPTLPMLAFLVLGHPWSMALAPLVKPIAVPAIIGERRPWVLAGSAALTGATALVAPGLWREYLDQLPTIASRLVAELGGGPTPLTIPTLAALAVLGPRCAGWLAIPALWPAWEYHYGVFTLPLADPRLALAAALPWRESIQVAVIALAVVRGVRLIRARRSAAAAAAAHEVCR